MIDESDGAELLLIEEMMLKQLPELCNGCYGCRVVQQMIERIQKQCPSRLAAFILGLAGHECHLALAQTGSHVLQVIYSTFSFFYKLLGFYCCSGVLSKEHFEK